MSKVNNVYLGNNIVGIPSKTRDGHNTKRGLPKTHIYKTQIGNYTYWKFAIKRKGGYVGKYFKKRKEAKTFLRILREVKNYNVASYLMDKSVRSMFERGF